MSTPKDRVPEQGKVERQGINFDQKKKKRKSKVSKDFISVISKTTSVGPGSGRLSSPFAIFIVE